MKNPRCRERAVGGPVEDRRGGDRRVGAPRQSWHLGVVTIVCHEHVELDVGATPRRGTLNRWRHAQGLGQAGGKLVLTRSRTKLPRRRMRWPTSQDSSTSAVDAVPDLVGLALVPVRAGTRYVRLAWAAGALVHVVAGAAARGPESTWAGGGVGVGSAEPHLSWVTRWAP